MDFNSFLEPLEELKECAICPRNCHADRFSEHLGWCKTDASFSISSICIHHGEEPSISGSKGICNIFFAHCNMQCVYCQNWQISDNRTDLQDFNMKLEHVIDQITGILDKGITMVGFVSPSHFIPQVRVIINIIHSLGYRPVWVFNTNGYDRSETIRSLEGIIDVYLPDFKYMDKTLALEYSDAADYPEITARAVKEMYRQKGSVLHLSEDGTADSGIIIRHLVLPGQINNSIRVLRFIAKEISPKLHISLMSQYYPTHRVRCHPLLHRSLTSAEYAVVVDEMAHLDMHNGWIQGMDSMHHYRPDFKKEHPFE